MDPDGLKSSKLVSDADKQKATVEGSEKSVCFKKRRVLPPNQETSICCMLAEKSSCNAGSERHRDCKCQPREPKGHTHNKVTFQPLSHAG